MTGLTLIGGPGCNSPRLWSASTLPTTTDDVNAGFAVGDQVLVGASMLQCLSNSAAAAVWSTTAGQGSPATAGVTERVISEVNLGNGSLLRRAYLEEAKAFTAAATASLTTQIPANSKVLFASLNFDTAIVLATAVKVGLGVTATPAGLALSGTAVTKNTKTNAIPLEANAIFTAATTLKITACATDGTAAGTVTSGTVRARVVYEYMTSIGNAP